MNRYTKLSLDGHTFIIDDKSTENIPEGWCGKAINRLACFENVYEDLIKQQDKLSKELEKLRQEGKTSSVKYKQLLANKFSNSNILILFKSYGCIEL